MAVFWYRPTAPCSLVEIDRRFRGAYWLHHLRPGDGCNKYLRKVGHFQCHESVCIIVLVNNEDTVGASHPHTGLTLNSLSSSLCHFRLRDTNQ
jgi:hypothetical protein